MVMTKPEEIEDSATRQGRIIGTALAALGYLCMIALMCSVFFR
jgi:hypothetical protein